jgi:hypothetical protein
METRTINLTYNPGTFYESNFSWTITNVIDNGTFVDGTPWVVVGTGAELIDLSPKSELKATTNINGRYKVAGITAWINGSAKNPIPYAYHDIQGNNIDPELIDRPYAGLTGPGKFIFDGRIALPGALLTQTLEAYQQYTINEYDETSNIGIVNSGTGQINPVGLTYGDVIITANCYWYVQEPENPDYATEAERQEYGVYSDFIPNAPRKSRTPIKNFGVLTVLREAPSELCFRPPLQWDWDDIQSRPDPIPVSSIRTDVSALDHRTPQIQYDSDNLMTGPQYHEGDEYYYQSSNCHWCIVVDEPDMYNDAYTYTRNAVMIYYVKVLADATNLTNTEEQRQKAIRKIVQYGIDCYGAVMSKTWTSGSAGHRQAGLKPWILLTGWYLNNNDFIYIFDSLRTRYSGFTYGTFNDEQLSILNFAEDFTSMRVVGSLADSSFGSDNRQTWSPDGNYRVVSSEIVNTGYIQDFTGGGNATPPIPIQGKFGKLNVATFNLTDNSAGFRVISTKHEQKRSSYPFSYLKITDGPGAGDTLYQVLYVHNRPGTINLPGEYLIVDRPWVNGNPTSESTVQLFFGRLGLSGIDGNTADIGRYCFSRNRNTLPGNNDWNDFSPHNDEYAWLGTQAMQVPLPALFTLVRATGITAFQAGASTGWYCYRMLGTDTNPFTGEKYSNADDSDIYTNFTFNFDITHPNPNTRKNALLRQKWLGWADPLDTSDTNYTYAPGRVDWTKIPGYGLTYDGTAIARVLNNWGNPGSSDFNGDGNTNALDLTFILSNFGT